MSPFVWAYGMLVAFFHIAIISNSTYKSSIEHLCENCENMLE